MSKNHVSKNVTPTNFLVYLLFERFLKEVENVIEKSRDGRYVFVDLDDSYLSDVGTRLAATKEVICDVSFAALDWSELAIREQLKLAKCKLSEIFIKNIVSRRHVDNLFITLLNLSKVIESINEL